MAGNDGEDELFLMCSPGQGGLARSMAVAMSVDAGGVVVFNDSVLFSEVREQFCSTLFDWASAGKFKQEQQTELWKKIYQVVDAFDLKFDM